MRTPPRDRPDLAVLVVGFGIRGRQWSAACRRAGIAVSGVVDPDPAAAAAAAAAGHQSYAALDEALAGGAPRAAIVASPPAAHAAGATACLAGGLAVLVEKPATLSLADARALAEDAARAGRPVLVGQNFRFLPRERALRRALAEDAVGAVVAAAVVSARPASAAAPHLAQVANGPLWDIVLHHLDCLRLRFGEPETVDAAGSAPAAPGERSELVLRLAWADGPAVSYRHTEGAPAFHHHEWIEGRSAALVVDGDDVFLAPPASRRRRVRPPAGPSPEEFLLRELAAAAGGAPSGLDLAQNLGTIALVEAAERSLALGRPVAPDEVAQGVPAP